MPDQTDTPSVADAIDLEIDPPEYPDGAPELLTIAQIRPRSKRAEFKRKLADFFDAQQRANAALPKASGGKTKKLDEQAHIRSWADADDLYQMMAELLELAAVNPARCVEWTDAADDETLVAVFQVFTKRAQPGEAPSSTS